MKTITDPANNNYDFGQDFNYAVWTPGSKATLTNVPWNNDYRDICVFPDSNGNSLDEYIDLNESANIRIENMSYLKLNVPVRLPIAFNKAFKYNYLRVTNPAQPISGGDELKSYYYFILDVKYIAPDTTELTIQLDVFQSFRNDFTLGNSYIERGHIGIANENNFDNNGRDWLTVPEGIDYGGEYRVIATRKNTVVSLTTVTTVDGSFAQVDGGILVVSTTSLVADGGTVENPILPVSRGTTFEGLPSGASVYYFVDALSFTDWLETKSGQPWVTQGIISITLIPKITRYQSLASLRITSPYNRPFPMPFYFPRPIRRSLFNNWRNNSAILNKIPERYRHLKKLLTYPYMIVEMTTWTGKAIVLKPESWADNNATITERAALMPPNQRITFNPLRYNAEPDSTISDVGIISPAAPAEWTGNGDDQGDYLDLFTAIANFPTLPIVNNGALGYLASNSSMIAYQANSADWAQQRALRGNQVAYDQATGAIDTSKNVNALQNAGIGSGAAIQNLLLAQQQAVTGIGNVITSGAQAGIGATQGSNGIGGIVGAVGGQVIGGITTSNQQAANDASAALNQVVSKGSNAAQNAQNAYVADTNKQLADWAARGDYENTIAGINAKVQDANMIQPTTSGQLGGESFNNVTGNTEVSLRWKLIDNAAIRRVGEYWLRYGYAVRAFGNIPSSLMVMEKFTYWKLLETYIVSASMPESFKQIIRGIFEKGVTVWADPTYIGTIDIADNTPKDGIIL